MYSSYIYTMNSEEVLNDKLLQDIFKQNMTGGKRKRSRKSKTSKKSTKPERRH